MIIDLQGEKEAGIHITTENLHAIVGLCLLFLEWMGWKEESNTENCTESVLKIEHGHKTPNNTFLPSNEEMKKGKNEGMSRTADYSYSMRLN